MLERHLFARSWGCGPGPSVYAIWALLGAENKARSGNAKYIEALGSAWRREGKGCGSEEKFSSTWGNQGGFLGEEMFELGFEGV